MAEKQIETSKQLLRGALILSVAGLIVKVMSAAYRVPYQNIVGDIGFYIYQQVYPFYGIVLTLSTIGFPMVISKLIAERETSTLGFSTKEILVSSLIVLGSLGVVMFSGLFLWAGSIAGIMGDPQLKGLLQIISFSFLLLPISAVLRGYYQGKNNMIPTAISQVTEQFIRVLTILILSSFLIQHGYSLYIAGSGAVFGSITGGLVGLLLLLGFVIVHKEWLHMEKKKIRLRNSLVIMKTLVFQGFSFCITGLILVLLQLVDSLHLYSLLRESGLGENAAKAWKGVYDRGQPLIQLGTIVSTSISLTMVPLITGYVKRNEHQQLANRTKLALKVSLTIGMAAAVGLISLIGPVNEMLFTNRDGSWTLAILSLSILFTSMIMVEAAILQSLGYTVTPILIVFGGVGLKWLLNNLLVPSHQVAGAAMATALSFLFMSLFLAILLKKHFQMPLFDKKHLWNIFFAIGCMSVTLVGYNRIFELWASHFNASRTFSTIQAVSGVLIGGGLFIMIILRKGLFTTTELAILPAGHKLSRFVKNKKRME